MSKILDYKDTPLIIDPEETQRLFATSAGFVPNEPWPSECQYKFPCVAVAFTVDGPPVGKMRARVFRDKRTQKSRAITPAKTRRYEQAIANVARLSIPKDWPLDRRYKLHVSFTGGRCDADNVVKSVADALEGVAYNNDRQVDHSTGERYGKGLKLSPRTTIRIEVLP